MMVGLSAISCRQNNVLSMPTETILERLRYLLVEMNPGGRRNNAVLSIMKKLILHDVAKTTRFECSIKIDGDVIRRSFRIINLEGKRTKGDYERRMNVFEEVLSDTFPGVDFGRSLGPLKGLRSDLPLFIGVESIGDDIVVKLYLNFFEWNRRDKHIASKFLKAFLFHIGLDIPLADEEIIVLALSFDRNGLRDECKVYYSYPKDTDMKEGYLSQKGRIAFEWLNARNRLDYYDIMERYRANRLISRKIGVHPTNGEDFLKLYGESECISQVSSIFERVNGGLETVNLENDTVTFYATLLDYGGADFYQSGKKKTRD